MYIRFDTIPECDGQTDGRTDRQTDGQTDLPSHCACIGMLTRNNI